MVERLPYTQNVGGSIPSQPTKLVRGSYSGNTLAFQANADSSILLPRSRLNTLKEAICKYQEPSKVL